MTIWRSIGMIALGLALPMAVGACSSGTTISPQETQENFIDPAEESNAFLNPNAKPKTSVAKTSAPEPKTEKKAEKKAEPKKAEAPTKKKG